MSAYTVSSTSQLMSALKSAQGGDTILLGAGTYSGLSFQGLSFDSAVTIRSADVNNQAVLTNFIMESSKGLSFDHLDFTATGSNLSDYAFRVTASSNISFDSLRVHGSLDNNANNDTNGFLIRDSSGVTVSNSEIQQLYTGINHLDDNGVVIKGNVVHDISMDGIRGGGSSNVQVVNNTLYNFHPMAGDHADAIQFWTVNAKAVSHDILISGNVYMRGNGDVAQGIFVEAGGTNPTTGLTITGNTITGGMYNGIAVFGGSAISVTKNVVVSYADMQSWIRVEDSASISASENSSNLYIFKNLTNFTESGDAYNKAVAVTTAEPTYTLSTSTTTTTTDPTVAVTTTTTSSPPTTTSSSSTTVPTTTTTVPTTTTTTDPVVTTTVDTSKVLAGTTGNDALNGGSANDSLFGDSGNDTLTAGAGDDTVAGGYGYNTINGGDGNDTISYTWLKDQGAHVDLSATKMQSVAGWVNDNLVSIENVIGTNNADYITGNAGVNILSGGAGNDFLTGGGGADKLYGGAGADRFIYNSVSESAPGARDTIYDFSHADKDLIDLHSLRPGNKPFALVTQFTGHAYEISVTTEGDHYVLQADLNGDKAADLAINIFTTAGYKFVASDFWT